MPPPPEPEGPPPRSEAASNPPPRRAPPAMTTELERLDSRINELDATLQHPAGFSEAKLFALKKELRMVRAARLKEARRLAA